MNIRIKNPKLILVLFALLLPCTIAVFGENRNKCIYVSPNGADVSGNGIASKPYKTISYALENIIEGQHNTIYLDSGEYIINDQIELPEQVDLIGSGVNKTILKADPAFYKPDPDGGYKNVLIYLFKGIGKQEIAHFTIDGDNKQLFGGLGIRVREKVYVHDLYIKETYYVGISTSAPSNSVFHSIKLENCSWGYTGYQHGALYLGSNIKNTDFHDFEIIEGIDYPSDAWGYAVKHMGMGGAELRNVRFFNSSFKVNNIGLWHDGDGANIALEYWHSNLYDCEIFNCQTNANFSLVESESLPEEYENFPIRIHHNTFDGCASHAIEASMDNIEVDQNYFTNSKFTIVSYNPESNYKNWNIHHNIFTDNKNITEVSFVRNKGGLSDLIFANNTCYITNSANMPIVRVESKESVNLKIINNILYKDYNTTPENIFKMLNDAEIENISIKNNLLYNYKVPDCNTCESGNNIVDEQPGLKLSGDKPFPFFKPTENSNLIDAGMDMNYPFTGERNDIGAHEMIIGAGHVPEVTINATIDTITSAINFQVEASDNLHEIRKIEVYADTHLLAKAESNSLTSSVALGADTIYFIKAFAYNSKGYMQAAYLTINSIELVTGIQRLTNNESISVYPNPAKDYLMIDLKVNMQIDNISVYSLKGEKVFFRNLSKKENKVEIEISHFKSGIYMVDVGLANRERIVKRIIIE